MGGRLDGLARVLVLATASAAAFVGCTGEKSVPVQSVMACGAILSGNAESRQCYAADSVPAGDTCVGTTQTRVCQNGVWSPDYDSCAHLSCFVQNGGDCGSTADGATESRPCYAADSVPADQTCQSTLQTRTCVAGAWSPDYPACDHLSCFVQGLLSCGPTPSGSNETRPCYPADAVGPGESCVATTQTRTCDNGAWSPDYPACDHLSCTVFPSTSFLRVNIGGSAYNGVQSWAADAAGSGVTFSTSMTTGATGPFSQNTADEQALLTTARWWDISAAQSAEATVTGLNNGSYAVRFLVCENVWTAVGARIFAFEAQGQRLDSAIDPYALAGSKQKVGSWRTYANITVSDGTLSLAWPALVDNPELRALEIAGPGFASGGSSKTFPRIGMYPIGGTPRSYDTTAFLDLAAKHDVVILGTWNGWQSGRTRDFGQVVDYIHQHTTIGSKVFFYSNYYDAGNGTDAVGSANYDAMLKCDAEHWWGYLNGSSGTRAPSGFGDQFVGNISHSCPTDANGKNYMQWMVDRDKVIHITGGTVNGHANAAATPDGVFHDLCYYKARSDWDYDRDGTRELQGDAAAQAQIRQMFQDQIAYWRSVFPGSLQIGNTSDYGDTTRDPAVWTGYLDGGVLEGLIGYSWSVETWAGFAKMKQSYQIQMSLYNEPKYAVFGYATLADTPMSGWSLAAWQDYRYAFAASQVLGDASFFAAALGDYDPNKIIWTDECDNAGAGIKYLGTATTGPQDVAWLQGVYRRDFANGIVLVNPKGNGTQTVALEQSFRKINGSQCPSVNNGAAVTSVTLQDRDGLVLLRP